MWISKPRTSLTTVLQNATEFIDEFCEKMESLLSHAFIAKKQSTYVHNLKESLKQGEFLVVCDFAENYAFVVQEAAPGFHWNNNQATVYPVVFYYIDDSVLCHKSIVIISDCLKHDTTAVYVFAEKVIEYIKSICSNVFKIFYVSDGAPQQYKNIKNFINLYHHKHDFDVLAEWHFYATAHGKGPCDGVGGTVKRMAARASLQLPLDQQITTPQELFDWASQPEIFPNIEVKYSTQEEYDIADKFLSLRYSSCKSIPGTHNIHSIVPLENGNVSTKRFSSSENSTLYKIIN